MKQDCDTCKNISTCTNSCMGLKYKKKLTAKLLSFIAK